MKNHENYEKSWKLVNSFLLQSQSWTINLHHDLAEKADFIHDHDQVLETFNFFKTNTYNSSL